MAKMQATSSNPEPYKWDEEFLVPPEALALWERVGKGEDIGKVSLADVKCALNYANQYLSTRAGRHFVDQHLERIAENLSGNQQKIVEACLALVMSIIVKDIRIQLQQNGECLLLGLLSSLLDGTSKYYDKMDGNGKALRSRLLDTFQTQGGLTQTVEYLFMRIQDSWFPSFKFIGRLLCALQDNIVYMGKHFSNLPMPISHYRDRWRKHWNLIVRMIGEYFRNIPLKSLEKENPDDFCAVIYLRDGCIGISGRDAQEFSRLQQEFASRLIASCSDKLRALGWDKVIRGLLEYTDDNTAPPRSVAVSNAGDKLVNGSYSFINVTVEGYAEGICYEKEVGAGQSLLLFPTTDKCADQQFGSQCRWVIISKNRLDHLLLSGDIPSDVIYYEAKATGTRWPPLDGWTDRSGGTDRPPLLRCHGLVVPRGEEENTLDHQLAKWIVQERVIERAFTDRPGCSNIALLMCHLAKMRHRYFNLVDTPETLHGSDYSIQARHVLRAWKACITSFGTLDSEVFRVAIAALECSFPPLPKEIAMQLLQAIKGIGKHLPALEWEIYFRLLRVNIKHPQSDEVRSKLRQLCWELRTGCTLLFGDCYMLKEAYEGWLKGEVLCSPSWKSSTLSRRLNLKLEDTLAAPRKPIVSVFNHGSRQIEASVSIESTFGEVFVGMKLYASTGDSLEAESLVLGDISRDTIAKCLKENSSSKVSVDAVLPQSGLWYVECCGLLQRQNGVIETPRSEKAVVDLVACITEEEKCRRAEIDEKDEVARQSAGEIHRVLRRLRGSRSSQMDIKPKFAMLNSVVITGRTILGDLSSLVEAHGEDEAAVSGISRLASALATASPAHAELEADFKAHSRKDSAKSFKAHLAAHVETGDVAAWLAKVTAPELEGLGGDPNLLYQCLFQGSSSKRKSPKEDAFVLAAALARTDLFSQKQIKALTERKIQMRGQASRAVAATKSGPPKSASTSVALVSKVEKRPATEVESAPSTEPTQVPLKVSTAFVTTKAAQPSNVPQVVTPTSEKPDDDTFLLSFLKKQATCLKGSPQEFHCFLVDTQDINTLDDLVDALTDDNYFGDVLQPCNVGVKGFKRLSFTKAVRAAFFKASKSSNDGTLIDRDILLPSTGKSTGAFDVVANEVVCAKARNALVNGQKG